MSALVVMLVFWFACTLIYLLSGDGLVSVVFAAANAWAHEAGLSSGWYLLLVAATICAILWARYGQRYRSRSDWEALPPGERRQIRRRRRLRW